MEKRAALYLRHVAGTVTFWFAGACLVLSICLLVVNGIGTGVGASGFHTLRSEGSAPHARATVVSTNQPVGAHTYWGTDDVPPLPKPHESTPPAPPVVTVPAQPVVSQVSTPPPAPAATPAPPPPPPAPAALPGRGAATTYGCTAAIAYLAAYAAPGFTFECPGYALGHQAMTCVNEAGVCDNERLIAIADPCAAAYMNEASNSWVLTGASDAPIDPYGACT